jgi:sporulation protein YlmC with PRC-barrel domain
MRYDYRIAGMAAIVAAVLVAAGLSFAADPDGQQAPQQATPQVAQAAVTATDNRATDNRAAGDTSATVIEKEDVQAILGRQVLSSAGEDMGRVIDIVVDKTGQVRAAVIDFGGFLGVGNRRVAVDWAALRFAPTGSRYDRISLELTREQVNAAPEYRDGRSLVVVGVADSLSPY